MLRANNARPGFYKKWHNKAMLIDIKKTTLVIERADYMNEPSYMDANQRDFAVPEFLLTVEDLAEEPQKERANFHWLTQAFSSLSDLLG